MIVMKNCALVLFHKIMMFETLAICWEKKGGEEWKIIIFYYKKIRNSAYCSK